MRWYEKSNLDGSNAAFIAVYFPAKNHIESFKWHSGAGRATLVRAVTHPLTNNVTSFVVYRLNAQGEQRQTASLLAHDGYLQIELNAQQMQFALGGQYWHSYDFDFASLSGFVAHKADKQSTMTFERLDFDFRQKPGQFKSFGEVQLQFIGEVQRDGRDSLHYRIGGVGLSGKQGDIWFDKQRHGLIGYVIPLGDEPGYDSVRLRLLDVQTLEPSAWQAFQMQQLQTH
ncbi:hypothetical protein [Bowmanella pacifica]|uniref:Uncharacterized protein n=1 Tax=Bowmanella pacifica TaxID=502051 RepID=A0A918DL69_9ALTE|nr:hypothetical protein [Bowmanella pacifica]GGO71098.1 hypothetical protein GCM10010982_26100 [Bowmanella pacifica]